MSSKHPNIAGAAFSTHVGFVALITRIGQSFLQDLPSVHKIGVTYLLGIKSDASIFFQELDKSGVKSIHDAYARRGDLPQVRHHTGVSVSYSEAWKRDSRWFLEIVEIAARKSLEGSADRWANLPRRLEAIGSLDSMQIAAFWRQVLEAAGDVTGLRDEVDCLVRPEVSENDRIEALYRVQTSLWGGNGSFGDGLSQIRREEAYLRIAMSLKEEQVSNGTDAWDTPLMEAEDAIWVFEASGFKFRGGPLVKLNPMPLRCLQHMVESKRKDSFGYGDFSAVLWPKNESIDLDDPEGAIRKNLELVRKALRHMAAKRGMEIPDNPLPHSSGGWRILLPR